MLMLTIRRRLPRFAVPVLIVLQTHPLERNASLKPLKTELRKAEVDLKRSKSKDYYKILGRQNMFQ